jgi:DNA segregation ATPase FtsK/SpoIIIE-like protein
MAPTDQNIKTRLPRNNPRVNHDLEAVLLGILFVLLGALCFTNVTIVSGLLNFLPTIFLGKLNFIAFLYLITLGFYRIFMRKPLHLSFNFTLIGTILVLLAVSGLVTHYKISELGATPTTLMTFFSDFLKHLPALSELPSSYEPLVGGGLLGYLFLGISNSLAGDSGHLLLYVLLATGLLLIGAPLWVLFFKWARKHRAEKRLEAARIKAARGQVIDEQQELPPVETPMPQPKPRPSVSFVPKVSSKPTYSKLLVSEMPTSGLRKVTYRRDVNKQPAPLKPSTPQDEYQAQSVMSAQQGGHHQTTSVRKLEPELHSVKIEPPRKTDINPIGEIRSVIPDIEPSEHVLTRPIIANKSYRFPSIDLLDDVPEETDTEYNEEVAIHRMGVINQTFVDLGVKAQAVSFQVGPSFTSFDIQLDRGTLVKSVATVINEISIRLGGMPALFTEVVPGKTTSTLEVPNEKISIVSFKEIIKDIDRKPEFQNRVVLPFGKNILGQLELLPLKDIIHMLVAGTTGSGKSVFMHTLIMTILMRSHPDDIKLIIIDPKRVEMIRYEGIPHLLAPIINEYSQAKVALTRLLEEMQKRYDMFQNVGISSIDAYNRYARDNGQQPLPLIATIIDEYADLVEGIPSISDIVERLAAMARASGIHMIIATQRPITRIVSGNIKNNIITKVALQMNAQVDSVTVLGHAGAEKLLGNGDMIVSCPKLSRYGELRLQGAFVSEDDTLRVTRFIKDNSQPAYHPNFLNLVDITAMGPQFPGNSVEEPLDERYEDIKLFTMRNEYMSSSRIMREFNMGFNRTLRIIKQLQIDGVLAAGPANPQSNKGIPVLIRIDDEESNHTP